MHQAGLHEANAQEEEEGRRRHTCLSTICSSERLCSDVEQVRGVQFAAGSASTFTVYSLVSIDFNMGLKYYTAHFLVLAQARLFPHLLQNVPETN